MEADIEAGREVEGFLASILTSENLSAEEVYSSTAELMMAAVDTVSTLPLGTRSHD